MTTNSEMKSHKHTCANYKCSILDMTQENYIGKIKKWMLTRFIEHIDS